MVGFLQLEGWVRSPDFENREPLGLSKRRATWSHLCFKASLVLFLNVLLPVLIFIFLFASVKGHGVVVKYVGFRATLMEFKPFPCHLPAV